MKIYDCLKMDHQELRESLNELVSLSEHDSYRFTLIDQISNLLIPHTRAEEAVFYNTLRAVNADATVVRLGYKEHLEAETLLRKLQVMDRPDIHWKPVAQKLQLAILNHIEDEELEIFDEARNAFSEEEAEQMGEAFQELRTKVAQEGIVKNTMDIVINLMPPRLADKMRNIGSGIYP